MCSMERELEFRIWVPGPPKSAQTKRKFSRDYIAAIQSAAKERVSTPLESANLEVVVLFADMPSRPDVDNVLKVILDALKGIVFWDDWQVRSVRAEALPRDDSLRIVRGNPHHTFARVLDGGEFLIRVSAPQVPTIKSQLESS